MKAVKSLVSDDIPMKFIYATVGMAAVLPEYIAPLMTLACFIVFKRHFSLTGQKVKMGEVGKVFLLFMCFSAISCIWSLTPIYSVAISLLWMGMLLGSFFISNMCNTRGRLETLVVCFSVGGGIVGAIGLLQYILLLAKIDVPNPLWSIIDVLIYKILPFSITDTAPVWSDSRAASTFDNPLICATYLIMALPVAGYGFTGGKRSNRTICGISALLILGGIVATTSRGAAIAAVVSIIILLFINSRKLLSVLVTLFAAIGGFAVVLLNRHLLVEGDMGSSSGSRIRMWKACWELIKNKPVLGYGAGCQGTSMGMAEYGVNKPHAHNLYIELTTELGFVGIAFFLVVLGFIVYDIIKLIRHGGIYGKMGVAALAVLAGVLVASLTEFTFQTPKELQYFMIFLGMLEAAKRLADKEPKKTHKPKKEKETVTV